MCNESLLIYRGKHIWIPGPGVYFNGKEIKYTGNDIIIKLIPGVFCFTKEEGVPSSIRQNNLGIKLPIYTKSVKSPNLESIDLIKIRSEFKILLLKQQYEFS